MNGVPLGVAMARVQAEEDVAGGSGSGVMAPDPRDHVRDGGDRATVSGFEGFGKCFVLLSENKIVEKETTSRVTA
jgi:hypothetical protein